MHQEAEGLRPFVQCGRRKLPPAAGSLVKQFFGRLCDQLRALAHPAKTEGSLTVCEAGLRASRRLRNSDRDHDRYADGVGAPHVAAPPMVAMIDKPRSANNDAPSQSAKAPDLQC